jgi:hypothetical protein
MNDKEAVDAIEKITSRMSGNPDAKQVAKLLASGHRTLQQNVMAFCLAFIDEMALNYETVRYDPRNEAGARVAKQIKDAVWEQDGKYPPPLPFI